MTPDQIERAAKRIAEAHFPEAYPAIQAMKAREAATILREESAAGEGAPVRPQTALEKLMNAPVAFGLDAQGLIPKVLRMRANGHTWAEIGTAINWDGDTVRKHLGWWIDSLEKAAPKAEAKAGEDEKWDRPSASIQEATERHLRRVANDALAERDAHAATIAELRAEVERLTKDAVPKDCDVRTILMEVYTTLESDHEERYAKNVAEVEEKMSNYVDQIDTLRASLAAAEKDRDDTQDKWGEEMCRANTLEAERDEARRERDLAIAEIGREGAKRGALQAEADRLRARCEALEAQASSAAKDLELFKDFPGTAQGVAYGKLMGKNTTPTAPKAGGVDEAVRAFTDEETPLAVSARDECLETIQPESGRWPFQEGMRLALARLCWESGWDSAIAALRLPNPPAQDGAGRVVDDAMVERFRVKWLATPIDTHGSNDAGFQRTMREWIEAALAGEKT